MDSTISTSLYYRDVPCSKAREVQANASTDQFGAVHPLWSRCCGCCAKTDVFLLTGKCWPSRRGKDGGGKTQSLAQVRFPVAQTSDLWH